MPLKIKRKPVDYKALEAGTYIARCVTIAGVGTQEEQDFKSKVPRYVEEICVVFECIGYTRCHKDGSPYTITVNGKEVPEPQTVRATYTRSLGSKAKLARHLTGWLGEDVTSSDEFDLEAACLGKACLLNVGKKVSETTGNEYNTIESISPLVMGMQEPAASVNTPVCYDVNEHTDATFEALPEWLQETVKQSSEWADMHAASQTINVAGGTIQPVPAPVVGGPDF